MIGLVKGCQINIIFFTVPIYCDFVCVCVCVCVCVKHRPATGNYIRAGSANRCAAECADKSKHESTGVNILSHLLWMRSLCQQRERPDSVFALPSAAMSKYTSRALVSCCTVSERRRYIPPRRTRKLFKLIRTRVRPAEFIAGL